MAVLTFANFEREDNARILTVREAFERSVNLVFIRLLRDIVRSRIFEHRKHVKYWTAMPAVRFASNTCAGSRTWRVGNTSKTST